jgi:hypothetical protein
MSKRTIIQTDLQLQNCINNNVDVEVWSAGYLDSVSKIAAFDNDTVTIEDGSYLRSNCVLIIIRSNYLQLVK